MKRVHSDEASSSATKKRRVDCATYEKWQRDLDHEYQTTSWLDCSSEKHSGKTVVAKLKCKICSEFESRIQRRKNFSSKWIDGAESMRVSNAPRVINNLIARAFNKLADEERERS